MGGSPIDFNIGGGVGVLGGQVQSGFNTLGSQDILGTQRQIAGVVGNRGGGGRLTAPLLQGGAATRRIRGRGASLQPGEGQGFLGSIQAGANPAAFDQLLLSLAGSGLRGR